MNIGTCKNISILRKPCNILKIYSAIAAVLLDVRKVDIWTICIIQVILDCLGQYGPFWATLDHFYQKMWFPNTSLKILLGTFLGHPVVITM